MKIALLLVSKKELAAHSAPTPPTTVVNSPNRIYIARRIKPRAVSAIFVSTSLLIDLGKVFFYYLHTQWRQTKNTHSAQYIFTLGDQNNTRLVSVIKSHW
jgi:hypothetical protein